MYTGHSHIFLFDLWTIYYIAKNVFFLKSFIIINYIYLPIDIRQVQKQNLNLKIKMLISIVQDSVQL